VLKAKPEGRSVLKACEAGVLRIGAVAAVAAVGADELAVQPVHLRAADLAVFAGGLQRLPGFVLLRLFFAHLEEYTGARRARHPQPERGSFFGAGRYRRRSAMRPALRVLSAL
jgi:hypothetical protein